MHMRKKTAFITGADGFIGHELVLNLLKENYDICVFLAEDSVALEEVNCEVLYCNMCNYESFILKDKQLLEKFKDSVFFHLAWQGSAGSLRTDYKIQLDNVKCTCDAVRLAKRLGARRFVGIGSIMEDECNFCVPNDGFTPIPTFQYSIAKYSAHLMAKTVANETQIEFVWGKISNAYGASDKTNRFINNLIQRLIKGEDFDLSTCEQNYDFIYVSEVARALRLIGENGKKNYSYYIGSGAAGPLKNFVEIVADRIKSKSKLNYGALKGGVVMLNINYFDSSKTRSHTGFECNIDFESGIDKTLQRIL